MVDKTRPEIGLFLAFFVGMTISTSIQPGRFVTVPDYHMPGRDDIEPGTNALVTGGNGVAGGGMAVPPDQEVADSSFFGEDGITFGDLLDILNPLQHIPVIGELYRAVSGDDISPGARMAGGTMYGGALGFVGALANSVVAEASGKDIGGNVLALFNGDGDADSHVLVAGVAPAAHDNALLVSLAARAAPAPWDKTNGGPTAMGVAAPSLYGEYLVDVPFASNPSLAVKNGAVQQTMSAASSQAAPALSPAAFHTLLRNINGAPKSTSDSALVHGGRLGLAAGGETPGAPKGTIREAGLEINRLLRPHAALRN
ncbi:MAG: hypothetical protein ISR50_05045 [Alphaproteobacteria bacterium]|nr:hypothetical protein [Alphaproteobacteria bacterium]